MRQNMALLLLLVVSASAHLKADPTRTELLKKDAQLEQRQKVLKETIKNIANVYTGNAAAIIEQLTNITAVTTSVAVPGAGLLGSGYNVAEKIAEARDAYKKHDMKEYNRALNEALRILALEGLTNVKYKGIGEGIEIANNGVEELTEILPLLEAMRNKGRSLKDLDHEAKKELGDVIRKRQDIQDQLSKLPETPSSRRRRREKTDQLKQEDNSSQPGLNDDAGRELDEAIELLDFLDKGDRAFKSSEDFERFAKKYPEIKKAYEAAYQAPGEEFGDWLANHPIFLHRVLSGNVPPEAKSTLIEFSDLQITELFQIPLGWVVCQCPSQHPGLGAVFRGVQYHSALFFCP